MVHCCVPECTNHSSKTESVSYHKIPRESKRRKAWTSRLRRENFPPLENCYVCSDHFEQVCFRDPLNLKAKLTGKKARRHLKPDAVPSIFNFKTSNQPTKSRSTRDRLITELEVELSLS